MAVLLDEGDAASFSDFFEGETLVLMVALVVEGVLASAAKEALLAWPEAETDESLAVIGGMEVLLDMEGAWRIGLVAAEAEPPWLDAEATEGVELFEPAEMTLAGFGSEEARGAIGANVLLVFLSTLLPLLLKMSGLFSWLLYAGGEVEERFGGGNCWGVWL